MTFGEARKRPDFKYTPVCKTTLAQLRDGRMKHMYRGGEPSWGEAVLEIGYIDIELNITAPCICDDAPKEPDDQTPVLDYFCCVKTENGDWEPYGYLGESNSPCWDAEEIQVRVDWNSTNWAKQLESDMFRAILWLCERDGLTIDSPNSPTCVAPKKNSIGSPVGRVDT